MPPFSRSRFRNRECRVLPRIVEHRESQYRESPSNEKASTENRRATRNPVPRIAEQRERPDREKLSGSKICSRAIRL
ncbi:unnamed protein product [Cochlearia groenlandica]